MSLVEVAAAIGLVLLVCVLAGSGHGWEAGASDLALGAGTRANLFYVSVAAAALAGLLAEHGRRSEARRRK